MSKNTFYIFKPKIDFFFFFHNFILLVNRIFLYSFKDHTLKIWGNYIKNLKGDRFLKKFCYSPLILQVWSFIFQKLLRFLQAVKKTNKLVKDVKNKVSFTKQFFKLLIDLFNFYDLVLIILYCADRIIKNILFKQ